MSEPTTTEPQSIQIPGIISVGDLAERLGLPVARVVGELMKNGVMATINEQIDFDTAAIIGADLGFEVQAEKVAEEVRPEKVKLAEGEGEVRPPLVAVMGHVDH